jgi:hypothetical protein
MNQNHSMKILLSKNNISLPTSFNDLELGLQDILTGGILEISDCYLLRKLIPFNFDVKEAIKQSFDKTQLECDINHIHVKDYLRTTNIDESYLLKQGLGYAYRLNEMLSKSNGFNVIFSYTTDPILDCNIRFHKKRVDEEWLNSDLENYDEAILTL